MIDSEKIKLIKEILNIHNGAEEYNNSRIENITNVINENGFIRTSCFYCGCFLYTNIKHIKSLIKLNKNGVKTWCTECSKEITLKQMEQIIKKKLTTDSIKQVTRAELLDFED